MLGIVACYTKNNYSKKINILLNFYFLLFEIYPFVILET